MHGKRIAFFIMVPVCFHLWPTPERTQLSVSCRWVGLHSNMHHGFNIPKCFSEPIRGFGKAAHINDAAIGAAPGPGWPGFPEFTTGTHITDPGFTDIIETSPKKFACYIIFQLTFQPLFIGAQLPAVAGMVRI